jgi:hypothetical protein
VIPAGLLAAHLERQRWFPGGSAADAKVETVEHLRDGWPLCLRVEVAVAGRLHQVVAGIRPDGETAEFLHGRPEAVIGRSSRPTGRGSPTTPPPTPSWACCSSGWLRRGRLPSACGRSAPSSRTPRSCTTTG